MMTETILLVIFAVAILAAFVIAKAWKPTLISKRLEAVVRIALCLIFAAIAHTAYADAAKGQAIFITAIAFNALVIYALTHVVDRLIVNQ